VCIAERISPDVQAGMDSAVRRGNFHGFGAPFHNTPQTMKTATRSARTRPKLCQAVGGVPDGTASRGERGLRGTLRALGPAPARGAGPQTSARARAPRKQHHTPTRWQCEGELLKTISPLILPWWYQIPTQCKRPKVLLVHALPRGHLSSSPDALLPILSSRPPQLCQLRHARLLPPPRGDSIQTLRLRWPYAGGRAAAVAAGLLGPRRPLAGRRAPGRGVAACRCQLAARRCAGAAHTAG
jgi:hypothetical protein